MATVVLQDTPADTSVATPATYSSAQEANEAALEIVHRLQRDVQCLSDGNKVVRRRAVERLLRDTVDKSPPLTREALAVIYDCLYKPLLKLFADEVDRTRELAVDLTSRLCCQIKDPEQYLPYIIPTVHERLTSEEAPEPTEEIRLLLVEILSKLSAKCGGEQSGIYINELVQILQKCLLDPFADVRKASCAYTRELAALTPQRFYQQGESLIEPLLKSLSHQHNKVRTMVLQTIGTVVLTTSGKAVNDVFTHIAQRTFDHSPTVRLMVTEVAGEWIISLRDRYSFFQKLIPLLLSGFSDEMPEIESKSKEYFKRAGELYEEENEDDKQLREKKEYSVTKHYHNLINHERPNLGCRTLVQRNFSKILPAIVNDIVDWNVATRVKTSTLLYWLVYHSEDYVTMNMQMLSQALYTGAQDEEPAVVNEVIKTATLVGLFVEPSVYCNMILPHLESCSTPITLSSALAVLCAYINGANYQLLADEIEGIVMTLEKADICSVIDPNCQTELLNCIHALVSKTGMNHSLISCKLFTIMLNVFALASTPDMKNRIRVLMNSLSGMLNFDDRYTMFETYSPNILSQLKNTCQDWTSQYPQCLIFVALLTESDRALGSMLSEAVPIFVQCCCVSRDAEMRQKMLTMMSHLVTKPMEDILRAQFETYAVLLIRDVVLPNCVWVAGRTAAAIRAIAVSFLWAMLQSHIVTNEHLKSCFKDLHVQLSACLDCHNETTRLVSVKVMLKLLQCCKGQMDVEVLHAIYPEILKRMDDSSNEVRLITAKAMSAFFQALPSNYERDFFKAHLEFIFKKMLLHMDDPSDQIHESCLECLRIAAPSHPGILKVLADDVTNKQRRKKACHEISKLCNHLLRKEEDGS